MKKLLAITLVLGLAAAASAVPSMTVPTDVADGATASIVISSDDAVGYGAFIEMTDPAGLLSNPIIMAAAGPDASVTDPATLGVAGLWLFQAVSFNPSDPVVAGDHFSIDYTAMDDNSLVTVTLYDFDANPIQVAQIQNTPEPLTLGLLGLGGLFLRRRK